MQVIAQHGSVEDREMAVAYLKNRYEEFRDWSLRFDPRCGSGWTGLTRSGRLVETLFHIGIWNPTP